MKIANFHKISASLLLQGSGNATGFDRVDLRNTLNLSSLRALCAVARYSSLTRAAVSLSRSQPALTLALTKLDRQFGVRLTERNRSGAHLTPAGELLYHRTSRMFDQLTLALQSRQSGARGPQRAMIDSLTDAQLRLIATVADHRELDSAARSLSVTPASLRRTAKSMEDAFGERLFDTNGHLTIPTLAGAELARKARLAVAEIGSAMDEIAIAQGRIESRISIGMVPLCATRILTLAINEFLEVYPNAQIAVAHGPYEPLLHDLRFGRIDILYGVLRRPVWASDVLEEPLFYDDYIIAVRRGHPLLEARQLKLPDLAAFEWVAPPKNTPRRESIERLFAASSHKPQIKIETSSLNMQRALLMGSDRITLLTMQEMAQEMSLGALQSLDLKPNLMRRNDGIAMRAGWKATRVQNDFLDILRKKGAAVRNTH